MARIRHTDVFWKRFNFLNKTGYSTLITFSEYTRTYHCFNLHKGTPQFDRQRYFPLDTVPLNYHRKCTCRYCTVNLLYCTLKKLLNVQQKTLYSYFCTELHDDKKNALYLSADCLRICAPECENLSLCLGLTSPP